MRVYTKFGTKERLFEMMKGVNGKNTINENYDSPQKKDEEYLSNSVDTDGTEVTKLDGDLNYPVEKDLRVKSDIIHQEPVTESEGSDCDSEKDKLIFGGMNEMDQFQQTQYNYDNNGNWVPVGHEDKKIGIRPMEQPLGSGNKKELIVKIDDKGGVGEILDQADDWNQAREKIKRFLTNNQNTTNTEPEPPQNSIVQ